MLFLLLMLALILAALAELIFGAVNLSLGEIYRALMGEGDALSSAIVTEIRAPRLFLGMAVGLGLAMSGCSLQGVLRNPLADPGLIGVTGGAAVGAVATIVLGDAIITDLPMAVRPFLLPVAAFTGAAFVTTVVFGVSRRAGTTSIATLILAGVAINAIAGAFIGAMVYISDDRQLRDLTFWTMGSLGASNWTLVLISAGIVLAAVAGIARMGRALDLFQLGERAAYHAGLDVEATKRNVAILSAIAVGAATAAAGPIGFIGLVAPHMARLIVGPEHRLVLPASALIGTTLLLFSDLLVRTAVPPAEPPIGLATSLIGGPFFLWLLLARMRTRGGGVNGGGFNA
ncbi:FecCD family ABC transporter permease [Pacificispira spongiicola]|nr:iron ABC transporter permease [Pacificispira spongiicola]